MAPADDLHTDEDRPVFLLGTGCQKGGTAWLHDYLGSSTETDLGFMKEYHVWDRLDLDEDVNEVPVGEPGEICVAGSLLAGGYWNLPEETSETFRDGWMHTGDIAREDEDGFWYIVDRTKDMIVTGGFNVFPREVEDVVAEHPAIAQVGVIGTPHEKFGEAVTAIVVLREGHELSEAVVAEIQDMVKERKGSVQAPKQIIATDALPLTGLGKPDKKALRAQYWTGERAVG